MRAEEPNWQPPAAVAMLTGHVAEQLADSRTQLALLEQARPSRPDAKILGDHGVSEILRVYGVMATEPVVVGVGAGVRRRARVEVVADLPAVLHPVARPATTAWPPVSSTTPARHSPR